MSYLLSNSSFKQDLFEYFVHAKLPIYLQKIKLLLYTKCVAVRWLYLSANTQCVYIL